MEVETTLGLVADSLMHFPTVLSAGLGFLRALAAEVVFFLVVLLLGLPLLVLVLDDWILGNYTALSNNSMSRAASSIANINFSLLMCVFRKPCNL